MATMDNALLAEVGWRAYTYAVLESLAWPTPGWFWTDPVIAATARV